MTVSLCVLLQGFYVHKLVEGLPAQRSGKMSVGDRIMEVSIWNIYYMYVCMLLVVGSI